MKLPNRKHTALFAIAVLLAAITMGCLGPCEALLLGIIITDGGPIFLTAPAGSQANSFYPIGLFELLAICDGPAKLATAGGTVAVPAGVYARTRRDLTASEPTATCDLVTSSSTPPGHYILEYRTTSPTGQTRGTLDLTIEEGAPSDVTACLYAYGDGEIIFVNQQVNFYGCCSFAPPTDPIVQYKWWFNYNGNPASAPSQTTSSCLTTHTYTTPGTKNTRLVVRTESGVEAEDTQSILVQSP